jgi:hypothetical protein
MNILETPNTVRCCGGQTKSLGIQIHIFVTTSNLHESPLNKRKVGVCPSLPSLPKSLDPAQLEAITYSAITSKASTPKLREKTNPFQIPFPHLMVALSLGNQTISGGAINSGAKRILDIPSAWPANGAASEGAHWGACVLRAP